MALVAGPLIPLSVGIGLLVTGSGDADTGVVALISLITLTLDTETGDPVSFLTASLLGVLG